MKDANQITKPLFKGESENCQDVHIWLKLPPTL